MHAIFRLQNCNLPQNLKKKRKEEETEAEDGEKIERLKI